MKITRRKFVQSGLTAFGAVLSSGQLLNLLAQQAQAAPRSSGGSRILILVQMSGGNDGLNTVIPYADPAYLKLRPSIGIKPDAVVKLNDKFGLNPNLGPLEQLYKDGHMAIVQGVGYPNPNRSHFRSLEIWQTAEPKKVKDTGWIGRYLDLANAGTARVDNIFPAINIDAIPPKTLSAEKVIVPSINDIARFSFKTNPRYEADRKAQIEAFNSIYDKYQLNRPYINELRKVGLDTTGASDYFEKLVTKSPGSTKFPNDSFGKAMQFITQLIVGGVNCSIYTLSIGGFDTHTNEVNAQGRQLRTLAESIKALYENLKEHDLDKDVVLMTFSEFGRRAAENGGRGSDHGAAAPMFVVGTQVRGRLVGDHPSLTDLEDGDLKYKMDFRNVYASVLDKWLSADSKAILGDKFDSLDLFLKT